MLESVFAPARMRMSSTSAPSWIARAKGINVEAELGRMEGSEDGVPLAELESVWTDPLEAFRFVKGTGVHYLAPSFENVHVPYPPGGAEKA